MSMRLRVALILAAALLLVYTIHKLRKSSVHLSDTIFWIFSSAVLLIIALFPGIMMFFSEELHVMSTANLVFAVVIALLILRVFLSSMEIATLRTRIEALSQEVALKEQDRKEQTVQSTQE